MNLSQIYHPITATPYNREHYMEYEPCDELKPYIRCFWGTKTSHIQRETNISKRSFVIPDTCMDIMFEVDFKGNKIDNGFAGINDSFFETEQTNDKNTMKTSFAIRFYAWSVILFADDSMSDVKNRFFDVDCYFSKLKKEIEPLLLDQAHLVKDFKSYHSMTPLQAKEFAFKDVAFLHEE